MSKARQLADLLDSNGDVTTGALDNVPPSNDASALTTGTLDATRIADGSIAAGKLTDTYLTGIADGSITDAKLNSTLDLSGKTISGIGGTVVQIVTNSTTTQTTKTGTGFADTALAATINKQQSSSKILVLMSAQLQAYRGGGGEARGKARIVRDGTEVLDFQMTTRSYDGANLHVVSALQALNAVDTTTGTGNRTYTLQIANNDTNSGTDYRLNVDGGSRSSVILLEIS